MWPTIHDSETARNVSHQGVWAALYIAVVNSVIIILDFFDIQILEYKFDIGYLVFAILYFIIAWMIHRMSRIAAFIGFALYLLEIILMLLEGEIPKNIIISIIIILMFINSIRGTLASHTYKKRQKSYFTTCPSCGAFQDADKKVCPNCRYVYSNITE